MSDMLAQLLHCITSLSYQAPLTCMLFPACLPTGRIAQLLPAGPIARCLAAQQTSSRASAHLSVSSRRTTYRALSTLQVYDA